MLCRQLIRIIKNKVNAKKKNADEAVQTGFCLLLLL